MSAAQRRSGDVIAALFGKRAFRFLLAAACCQALLGYAVISWGAQFLIRVHAMTPTAVGATFGLIGGLAGALGITLGGLLADRAAAHDVRWYAWLSAFESLAAFPFGLVFLLSDDAFTALAAFAPFYFLNNMYVGSLWSLTQGLVAPRMRAVAAATQLAVLNFAGLFIGPLARRRAQRRARPEPRRNRDPLVARLHGGDRRLGGDLLPQLRAHAARGSGIAARRAADALEAHRAVLVRGLARVRVERREGEPVGRRVVHGHEDLPGCTVGVTNGARRRSRRGATRTHDPARSAAMPSRAASSGWISTYDSSRVELAQHGRLARCASACATALDVPRPVSSSERELVVGRLGQRPRRVEDEARAAVGVVEAAVREQAALASLARRRRPRGQRPLDAAALVEHRVVRRCR